MMIVPPRADGSDLDGPSTWGERGVCPFCGSAEVIHRVIGMVLAGADDDAPPWVEFSGCCGIGPDRSCLSCGEEWWAGSEDPRHAARSR
ncbi:hypothetical protein DEO23_00615 [Brachybacterium endophyticum]|uniref:Uncharacterized protein n=1 Tax=Brachybacterium endophyticum TaxID=2182385 RepID=A0A2U2RMW0_9MICO|nr:hypothetical protein [Brachybacterium endophyticum]PWH07203.1 hypothetical protein DEO23_00615 [Brachybacterium endophyticum]